MAEELCSHRSRCEVLGRLPNGLPNDSLADQVTVVMGTVSLRAVTLSRQCVALEHSEAGHEVESVQTGDLISSSTTLWIARCLS